MLRILFVLISLLIVPSVSAERIVLRSGFEFEGRLIEKTERFIKMDFLGTPVTYYLNEVDSLDGQKVLQAGTSGAQPFLQEREEPAFQVAAERAPEPVLTVPAPMPVVSSPVSVKAPGTLKEDLSSPDLPATKRPGRILESAPPPGTSAGWPFSASVLWTIVGILLAAHVFTAVCLERVARKALKEPAWWAWLPVGNFFLMSKIAGTPYQWLGVLATGIVPVVGIFIVYAYFLFLWYKIALVFNPPVWVSRLVVVPVVGFVAIGYLAFGPEKSLAMLEDPLQRKQTP